MDLELPGPRNESFTYKSTGKKGPLFNSRLRGCAHEWGLLFGEAACINANTNEHILSVK